MAEKTEELMCEVCVQEKAVGVASMPGVPYSAAYGRECLKRGADPYWICRANVAVCGGVDKIRPEFLESNTFVDGQYMTLGEALKLHPLTEEELKGPPEREEIDGTSTAL